MESGLTDFVSIENGAGIARITCGWKLAHLPLEAVRCYWRDVHSPAISRRAGLYEYRHSQFKDVDATLLAPVAGINYSCPADQQLMWLSDVRYRNQAALDLFTISPGADVRALILGDIDLLVDQSTTYKSVGDDAKTYLDTTGEPTPIGPAAAGSVGLFFRQNGDAATFRAGLTAIAALWARTPGVKRVRLNLFEAPDMEAERQAGYPIKTHPVERQYQAWIDLMLDSDAVAKTLLTAADGVDYASFIREIHAYPVNSLYTFVYNTKPTLVALRGYAAYQSIMAFNAQHQVQPALLEWMYGDIVNGIQPKEEAA